MISIGLMKSTRNHHSLVIAGGLQWVCQCDNPTFSDGRGKFPMVFCFLFVACNGTACEHFRSKTNYINSIIFFFFILKMSKKKKNTSRCCDDCELYTSSGNWVRLEFVAIMLFIYLIQHEMNGAPATIVSLSQMQRDYVVKSQMI